MPRPEDEYDESDLPDEDIELGKLDWSPGEPTVDTSQIFENRVDSYCAGAEAFGIKPEIVYEPANGSDVSTATAFPEAEVLFAEVNSAAVEQLSSEGYNIRDADAEALEIDENVDLAVFRNAAINAQKVLNLNPADYVFANDYLNNASEVDDHKDYELLGVIHRNTQDILSDRGTEFGNRHVDDLYVFSRTD